MRDDEERDTGRRGESSSAREGQEGNDEQGRREENEDSKTEKTRRAMAEAVWKMEREEEESGHVPSRENNGGSEGQRRAQTLGTRTGPPAENNDREDGERHATSVGKGINAVTNTGRLVRISRFKQQKWSQRNNRIWSTQMYMRMMEKAARGSK